MQIVDLWLRWEEARQGIRASKDERDMRDWCAGLTEDQRDAVVEMLTARAMRGQEASFECMAATSMICKFHMENNKRRYEEHCAESVRAGRTNM